MINMKYKYVVMDRDGEWMEVTDSKEDAQKCVLNLVEETGDFEIKRFSEKFVNKKKLFYDR